MCRRLQRHVHKLLRVQSGEDLGLVVEYLIVDIWSQTFCICVWFQPGDDIVKMCQDLEKYFLEKVAQMPQDEFEISALTTKAPLKGGRKSTTGILTLR